MRFEDTFQMVKRAIDTHHPAHGYLIVGPVRGAAMEFAFRVLQTLFCTADEKPCGVCDECRRVTERKKPDIQWIFPEKKSRVISVDQVRDTLIYEITQTSFAGGWKAGVVVGVDRMNEASANTFLKTLEEPPERTLFLLLSDQPQHLLPTIVSRCQRIDLSSARELEEPWRERVLEVLASPLWGHPFENLALSTALSNILGEIKENAETLVKQEDSDLSDSVEESDEIFKARVEARYRELRTDFMLTLTRWFRDLMVVQAGGDHACVFNQTYLSLLIARAQKISLARACYNINACEELARQMERSIPDDSVLAYTMDRISHGVK